jgi:hypothetical protein
MDNVMIDQAEDGTFQTGSLPLAIFVRYALGDETHLTTRRPQGSSCYFTFSNADECRELQQTFFSKEPVAIGDVRALLEVDREIRWTIRQCDQSGTNSWTREA